MLRLHTLPREILTVILLLVQELHTCIAIESLFIGLPKERPDVVDAFNGTGCLDELFPASVTIANRPWFGLPMQKIYAPSSKDLERSCSLLCAIFILAVCPKQWQKELTLAAAFNGKVKCLKYIKERPEIDLTGLERSLMRSSAAGGHVEAVSLINEWYKDSVLTNFGIRDAALAGHLDIIVFLHNQGERMGPEYGLDVVGVTSDMKNIGVSSGRLDVVKYLHENNLTEYTVSGLNTALRFRNLDIVKYLHEMVGINCIYGSFDAACSSGSRELVDYILAHCGLEEIGPIEAMTAVGHAAEFGHHEILSYLLDTFGNDIVDRCLEICEFHVMFYAVFNAQVECIKILLERTNDSAPFHALQNAVWKGSLETLELMYAHRHRMDEPGQELMDDAAASGRVETVRFLHIEAGMQLSNDAISLAAESGHLEVVKYIGSNSNATCTQSSMVKALKHFEVVKYLIERGWEGNVIELMENAAGLGLLKLVKFLHPRIPDGQMTAKTMDVAAGSGHFDILKFLHFQRTEGCTSKALDAAATQGWLDIVEFLHHSRKEGCTTSAMNGAAREGYFEVVKFLHFNRTEGCTTAAMDEARTVQILEFLHKNRNEGCSDRAIEKASRMVDNSKLLMIEYLFEHNLAPITDQSIMGAIESGHFKAFCFLHDNFKGQCTPKFMKTAVMYRRYEVIEYLHSHCPAVWPSSLANLAAIYGELKLYAYLTEECKYRPTLDALRSGAMYHLDILKFMTHHQPELTLPLTENDSTLNLERIANMHALRPDFDLQSVLDGILQNSLDILEQEIAVKYLKRHLQMGCKNICVSKKEEEMGCKKCKRDGGIILQEEM
ncbi:hypothetical protein HDU97_004869 [Phlyctochytrium planicorne]|nr:hypothetical protein HDU97_004869 [Phlyctochytrium planicorne]